MTEVALWGVKCAGVVLQVAFRSEATASAWIRTSAAHSEYCQPVPLAVAPLRLREAAIDAAARVMHDTHYAGTRGRRWKKVGTLARSRWREKARRVLEAAIAGGAA